MCGRPLRAMLERILGKDQGEAGRFIGGVNPPTTPELQPPGATPSPPNDWPAWARDIDARIRAVDAAKQDKGDYLQPGDIPDLSPYAKRDELNGGLQSISTRFESILGTIQSVHQRIDQVSEAGGGIFQGLSMGKLLVGALGLSGPLGLGVIVASGLIAARRNKHASDDRGSGGGGQSPFSPSRKRGQTPSRVTPIAVDSPPPPQRAVPETHYVSYEVDAFAKAHQWASEQVVRKYPGAAEIMQAQDSLIKQHLSAH
jgi:hypothetical protein